MRNKIQNLEIRKATIDDLMEIQNLFVETINSVCDNDYSKEQLKVWISGNKNKESWINKLKSQFFLVAEHDHYIVGFGSLSNGDYIDFMYVHKDYQRQGIADKLLSYLEKESQRQGVLILKSDVSKTARPFFERNGFQAINEQTRIIDSIAINNFKMEKVLERRPILNPENKTAD